MLLWRGVLRSCLKCRSLFRGSSMRKAGGICGEVEWGVVPQRRGGG